MWTYLTVSTVKGWWQINYRKIFTGPIFKNYVSILTHLSFAPLHILNPIWKIWNYKWFQNTWNTCLKIRFFWGGRGEGDSRRMISLGKILFRNVGMQRIWSYVPPCAGETQKEWNLNKNAEISAKLSIFNKGVDSIARSYSPLKSLQIVSRLFKIVVGLQK